MQLTIDGGRNVKVVLKESVSRVISLNSIVSYLYETMVCELVKAAFLRRKSELSLDISMSQSSTKNV